MIIFIMDESNYFHHELIYCLVWANYESILKNAATITQSQERHYIVPVYVLSNQQSKPQNSSSLNHHMFCMKKKNTYDDWNSQLILCQSIKLTLSPVILSAKKI